MTVAGTLSALTYLGHEIWPGLAIAGAIGLAVGYASVSGRPAARPARVAASVAAVLLVACAVLALSASLPGRPGLWLDIAVALALAYTAAWGAGAAVRAATRRGPRSALPADDDR